MEAIIVSLAIAGLMGTSFHEPKGRARKAPKSTQQPGPHTITARGSNILPPSMIR